MFFIFHDLSVRTRGTYRLKFTLVDISSFSLLSAISDGMMGAKVGQRVKAEVVSRGFEVFTPVTFPGSGEPTEL
ncbi:hypothetical protein HK097_003089, partial [Rhizophlyctis rosea]